VLALQCRGLRHLVTGAREQADPGDVVATLRQCDEALEQARAFLAGLTSPPESARDRAALESSLHALDHIARQNETAREHIDEHAVAVFNEADAIRAGELCARVLALAADLAERVSAGPESESARIEPGGSAAPNGDELADVTTLQALASELADLRRAHRPRALASVARGERSATDAIGEVERVRRLDRLAYHAWRATAHLIRADAGADPS
jgi:phosphate:Na+ symporter